MDRPLRISLLWRASLIAASFLGLSGCALANSCEDPVEPWRLDEPARRPPRSATPEPMPTSGASVSSSESYKLYIRQSVSGPPSQASSASYQLRVHDVRAARPTTSE